jgi:ectoine hydroxylase-related dioxygenase (phytanoyl-CoA dioxygenase family)
MRQNPLEVKAGQVVFFSRLLVHLSPPNPSRDRYRRALTMDYTRAEVQPHEHALAKHAPVLCGGQDASGLWSLLPRPESEK